MNNNNGAVFFCPLFKEKYKLTHLSLFSNTNIIKTFMGFNYVLLLLVRWELWLQGQKLFMGFN